MHRRRLGSTRRISPWRDAPWRMPTASNFATDGRCRWPGIVLLVILFHVLMAAAGRPATLSLAWTAVRTFVRQMSGGRVTTSACASTSGRGDDAPCGAGRRLSTLVCRCPNSRHAWVLVDLETLCLHNPTPNQSRPTSLSSSRQSATSRCAGSPRVRQVVSSSTPLPVGHRRSGRRTGGRPTTVRTVAAAPTRSRSVTGGF